MESYLVPFIRGWAKKRGDEEECDGRPPSKAELKKMLLYLETRGHGESEVAKELRETIQSNPRPSVQLMESSSSSSRSHKESGRGEEEWEEDEQQQQEKENEEEQHEQIHRASTFLSSKLTTTSPFPPLPQHFPHFYPYPPPVLPLPPSPPCRPLTRPTFLEAGAITVPLSYHMAALSTASNHIVDEIDRFFIRSQRAEGDKSSLYRALQASTEENAVHVTGPALLLQALKIADTLPSTAEGEEEGSAAAAVEEGTAAVSASTTDEEGMGGVELTEGDVAYGAELVYTHQKQRQQQQQQQQEKEIIKRGEREGRPSLTLSNQHEDEIMLIAAEERPATPPAEAVTDVVKMIVTAAEGGKEGKKEEEEEVVASHSIPPVSTRLVRVVSGTGSTTSGSNGSDASSMTYMQNDDVSRGGEEDEETSLPQQSSEEDEAKVQSRCSSVLVFAKSISLMCSTCHSRSTCLCSSKSSKRHQVLTTVMEDERECKQQRKTLTAAATTATRTI